MRALLLCAVVLCGCEQASEQSHLQPLQSAVKYVGYNERINRVELDTLLGVAKRFPNNLDTSGKQLKLNKKELS